MQEINIHEVQMSVLYDVRELIVDTNVWLEKLGILEHVRCMDIIKKLVDLYDKSFTLSVAIERCKEESFRVLLLPDNIITDEEFSEMLISVLKRIKSMLVGNVRNIPLSHCEITSNYLNATYLVKLPEQVEVYINPSYVDGVVDDLTDTKYPDVNLTTIDIYKTILDTLIVYGDKIDYDKVMDTVDANKMDGEVSPDTAKLIYDIMSDTIPFFGYCIEPFFNKYELDDYLIDYDYDTKQLVIYFKPKALSKRFLFKSHEGVVQC